MSDAKAPPNRIKSMRQALGLDKGELAKRLGVDKTTLWRWEERRAEIPDARKIALAAFFGTTVDWLIVWPDANGDDLEDAA